jgi:hypothetical protein
LCGFNELTDRDERIERAYQILNSAELKQAICLKILGTTFKDVEKAMDAILKERHIPEEKMEELEEDFIPEKFDPEVTFIANKQAASPIKNRGYTTLSREDVARLMAASKAEPKGIDNTHPKTNYPTLSREECERLVREYFEYKQKEIERKRQQEAQEEIPWVSTKTTESAPKTKSKTKRIKCTKD